MKPKAMIPLLLGLAIGIATVKFAVNTLRKAQAANQPVEVIRAVRAKQDIGAYKEIAAEMVEIVETAESPFAPVNGRIESLEEVIGRVTAKPIPQHAAILKSMLAQEGTTPGIVGRIPPGYRAVSVRIDEVTGVAYQITPGDWVDVIVVMDIDNRGPRGGRETIAEVILQHVQVAAIGHTIDVGARRDSGKVQPAKSATLLIREEEVPKLHLAATQGRITLAMRGDDTKTTQKPLYARMGDVVAVLRPKAASGKANPDGTSPYSLERRMQSAPEVELPHAVLVYHGSPGGETSATVERITFEHSQSPKIIDVAFGPPTRGVSAIKDSKRSR